MIIQILSVFAVVAVFSFLLEVPRHLLEAAFLSSLMVPLFSHILARIKKAPVTVFLVSGILPAVPGTSIYRCVYYLIQDATDLSILYLIETLQIAGAIAMAIFIMDSFFRLFLTYQSRRAKSRS